MDRIPRTASPASTRCRAARPIAVGGGARWMQPWFGAGSRVRQRVEFDRADYDLHFKSAFGESDGNTQRSHARIQTDVVRQRRVRVLRRPRVARRERRQHVHHRRARPGEIPVERSVLGLFGEARWNASDRATVTAGVRGERITSRCIARRSARVPAAA